MTSKYLSYISGLLVFVSTQVFAVAIQNITTTGCPAGVPANTPNCRCGDGFVQTNLGEECDLGKKPDGTIKNGLDEGNDGIPDYGCDKNCKIVKNDPNKDWECNSAPAGYSTDPILAPKKADFNDFYLQMIALYKKVSSFSITNCATTNVAADREKCVQQSQDIALMASMNLHQPFFCDSQNALGISEKSKPNITYYDYVAGTNVTKPLFYESNCGSGDMLLVPTNLKWLQTSSTNPTVTNYPKNYEALYNCKMHFIKTVSGKFVRHTNWVMYFIDDPNSTIAKLINETPNQAAMEAYFPLNAHFNLDNNPSTGTDGNEMHKNTFLNDILYCVRKIDPSDARSQKCDDPALCYDILAKYYNKDEVRKFNDGFDFTKDPNNAGGSGVLKFPKALLLNGEMEGDKDSVEIWDAAFESGKKYGIGFFTIYPEGSSFPWFRPL